MPKAWIAAGLFAEGPSDYDFLGELLPRVVRHTAQRLFGPDYDMFESVIRLDAPWERRRDAKIAAALDAAHEECTLLFIHADGNGDPERARAERVAPGAARVARIHPDIPTVPCVPVREMEAWVLVDAGAFDRVLGRETHALLPDDPESSHDPKQILDALLADIGVRIKPVSLLLPLFGREVDLRVLHRLPAFGRMIADLESALQPN